MTSMTESYRVRQINAQLGERYRNRTSGRSYLLILEVGGECTLEGIDRRTVEVTREHLEDPYSAWERIR